jgi:hypothetical protein
MLFYVSKMSFIIICNAKSAFTWKNSCPFIFNRLIKNRVVFEFVFSTEYSFSCFNSFSCNIFYSQSHLQSNNCHWFLSKRFSFLVDWNNLEYFPIWFKGNNDLVWRWIFNTICQVFGTIQKPLKVYLNKLWQY